LIYPLSDVALWKYDITYPAYMQLFSLKWHTYHVEFHPDEVCLYLEAHVFIHPVIFAYIRIFIYRFMSSLISLHQKQVSSLKWHMWATHWCINCVFNDLFNLVASKFYVRSMWMPKKHHNRIFHFSHYANDMLLELHNCFYIINKIVKLWIIYGHSTAFSNC